MLRVNIWKDVEEIGVLEHSPGAITQVIFYKEQNNKTNYTSRFVKTTILISSSINILDKVT